MRVLAPLDRVGVNAFLHHFPQRTHLTQTRDVLDTQVHGIVDLLLRREATNAEADGRVRQVLAHANGTQHVRRLQRCTGARTARRNGNVLKRHQQTLSLHIRKGKVKVARVSFLEITVKNNVFDTVSDPVVKLIRQVADPAVVVLHLKGSDLTRLTEAYTERSR
ncbi:hypothetical protein PPTG_23687 [Phytophthora nicotianae INRA-310]|uniref:Uncharacterized protein n=1 Tax=Phytophthora nicotianae (strain INRA-310) TaxID=761204 RepID=W2PVI9_PHYN3|nr:hypothetical protein PPTG_23687 [Phytophthora nicotianae INRA-310]ETN04040.1 hypothetical protein PPTG_23687 [Phytophthora nicotianae INRA-310]